MHNSPQQPQNSCIITSVEQCPNLIKKRTRAPNITAQHTASTISILTTISGTKKLVSPVLLLGWPLLEASTYQIIIMCSMALILVLTSTAYTRHLAITNITSGTYTRKISPRIETLSVVDTRRWRGGTFINIYKQH